MAYLSLIKVSPLNASTGSRVDLYIASANDRRITGLNSQVWEPAITTQPILSFQGFNGDFTAPIEPGEARFAFSMEVVKKTWASADTYVWAGAPVTIYAEEPGTAWPWTTRFVGKVRGFGRKGQTITLNASVDPEPFTKDVLTAVYAGTGSAEGGSDIKNRVKPLVIGWAMNVEPVLINATNSVYQFSGYGAIEAVTTLYERGSAFSASVGDYANYAALVAATIAPGKWGTCLAEGLVRLGAPAYGVITGDVKGHKVGGTTPRLTGAIINALATIAGVSSGNIETTTISGLDTAVPYNINLVLSDQIQFLDLVRRLALPCNHQAGITLAGKLFVTTPSFSVGETLTLNARGRALPQVVSSDELDVSPPYYRTVMGANRAWRVHSPDEIAYDVPIVDSGRYDAATTYRDGNTVDLANGSRWLYIYATPTAGNAPPAWPTTSNTWWQNLSPPLDASGITYADGTPIENLQPGEAGAGNGDNLISNAAMASDASFWVATSCTRQAAASGDPSAFWRGTVAANPVAKANDDTIRALSGATKLWATLSVRSNVATSTAKLQFKFYKAGALDSTVTTTAITAAPINTWVRTTVSVDVPAGCDGFRVEEQGTAGSGSAYVDMAAPRVGSTEPAADVTAAAQVSVELATDKNVPATYTGTVSATDLAAILWAPVVTKGGSSVKIANGTTYALANATGVISGTGFVVDNTTASSTKGNVTIASGTVLANTATVDLTITVDGVAQPKITLRLEKVLAAAPPSGGGGGNTVTWSSGEFIGIDTTSYTAVVSPVKTLALASGDSFYGTAPLDYTVSGVGATTRTMTFKWQYSVAGANSWNDFGAGITGTTSTSGWYDGETFDWNPPDPGYVAVTQTKSGLGAGDYDLRLVAICSATGKTCTPSGTATVESKT